MFSYTDPTRTGVLQQTGALAIYREEIDRLYKNFHAVPDSAFTLLEAFNELAPGVTAASATINWRAFPVAQSATPAQIDADRLSRQEEYVEWRVEKKNGALERVTFTVEFPEYFEALAQIGADRLKEEVVRLHPGANPTDEDLFGANFNPAAASPRARASRFRAHRRDNPWNNGQRGILCLTHRDNTLGALFNLLGFCGIPRTDINPGDVCAVSNGACGPGRNSDPSVCINAQNLARGERSFSLNDPCGIRIVGLDPASQWTIGGQAIDMNDEANNRGLWKVTRNGRRAVFNFEGDVRVGGQRIETGAALSRQLIVAADVIHAPDAALPEWARQGNEELRAPIA